MDKTSLGDRMKDYERVTQGVLMRRTPVIIRLDGKSFHTFTKRFREFDDSLNTSPFSEAMHACMAGAAHTLVHQIQGARIAYANQMRFRFFVPTGILTRANNGLEVRYKRLCLCQQR